jgi:hypothetical protein
MKVLWHLSLDLPPAMVVDRVQVLVMVAANGCAE